MSHEKRENITRDTILALLSDAEVARVSRAEDEPRLVEGDEYVDLDDADSGVHQVHETSPKPRRALPRSAVADETWAKIVRVVAR